ncbi:radical SAM protein [Magnetofaba australis]|uniref:Putative radical SAM protein n=1 Tax=Magnetofaba australis IT-1 TaxID=1434232 RepID=A0A1Y2K4E3_9PROT|nr:radical SAM protein [Magnetofaba australis]OSM04220.1 putative radical SAM protein [Magnetofaba australis IT-1]
MSDKFGIDSHKLMHHPERVAQLMAAGDDWELAKSVYPIYMEVSPVGACNHRCGFCAVDYIGYPSHNRLDAEVMSKRLAEMGRLGVKSIMYAGEGEPLLHKQMARIIGNTHAAGIDSALTTNATVLPPGFVDEALPLICWIKASINAGSADNYAKIHQTKAEDFDIALANLQRLTEARKRGNLGVTLGAQCLLLPDNAHEVAQLAKICRDQVGLDYLVVKPYSQHLFSETRQYEDLTYEDYLSLDAELAALNSDSFQVVFRRQTMEKYQSAERYDMCRATPFLWAYIMSNGTVSGCSAFLLDKRFEYGNINEMDFQQIWEGEGRRAGFEFVRHGLDISACRSNCRMDAVNRYLTQLEAAPAHRSAVGRKPPHVNFI